MIDMLKSCNHGIHYFGLGFIQIKVNNINYHFYTNKWTIIEDNIHTHKYNFTSNILKGKLTQTIYTEINGKSFSKTLCDCKEGSEIDFVDFVDLKPLTTMTIEQGSSYTLDNSAIHRVSSDFCITEVLKDTSINEKAIVYKPLSMIDDVCPFIHIDESELWAEVERMLNEK